MKNDFFLVIRKLENIQENMLERMENMQERMEDISHEVVSSIVL
jgi:hypothetical protein